MSLLNIIGKNVGKSFVSNQPNENNKIQTAKFQTKDGNENQNDYHSESHNKNHQKNFRQIFKNLNFELLPGQFHSLLGPSGCGKSTLLRLLANLDQPSSGEILNSKSLSKAMVFQEPRLIPWLNCAENILLPTKLGSTKDRLENSPHNIPNLKDLLSLLDLNSAQTQYPEQLSGGMKMRTALARSLILQPQLWLLDEPLSALDEPTRLNLQTQIRNIQQNQNLTGIFVTHSIEEACYLSDTIFLFHHSHEKLIRVDINLPKIRNNDLREQIDFFEECKRVRQIFKSECFQ